MASENNIKKAAWVYVVIATMAAFFSIAMDSAAGAFLSLGIAGCFGLVAQVDWGRNRCQAE